MKRNPKRTLLAWLLTAAMLVSLLPSAALAASDEAAEEETATEQVEESTATEQTEDSAVAEEITIETVSGEGYQLNDAATSGTCGDNLTWTLENGVLTISGTGDMTDYYNDAPWYNSRESITSVVIGDGVTSIGEDAFYNCTGLTSITIGSGVASIGWYAFYNTAFYNDESNWENGVLYLEDYLLKANSDSLEGSYTIKDGTTVIADDAFRNCIGLTSVTIPDSVTSIGSSAFSGCIGLTGVAIPDSVTSIGGTAFSGCIGLTGVAIPDSVTSIDSYTFYGCTGLTSVTIPDSVTSIGSGVFYYCTSLTTITIPDSVISIGMWAFEDCTGLTSVTIGSSVTIIGAWAFDGCTGLTSVTIGSSVTRICDCAFYGCTGLTSVTIPDSVTSIGSSAFYGCTGLTSVTIPDSVTSIGSDAFYNTAFYNDESNWENGVLYLGNHLLNANPDSLEVSYAIKEGTTVIADYAFSDCTVLTSVTIPDGVTSIGGSAFEGCTVLTSVTIGSNVTSIGSDAFYNTAFYNDESNWENGVLYLENYLLKADADSLEGSYTIKEGTTVIAGNAFSTCTGLTSVTIPDSVTGIGEDVFYRCTGLTSVTIPDSVTNIGDSAFYGCTGLISVTIPDSVASIGWYAFYDCTSLTSAAIPNGVTAIDESTFESCSSLTSVTIPDSVTSIANYAFWNCGSLTDVYYSGSKTGWMAILIGDENICLTSATLHCAQEDTHAHSYTGTVTKEATCGADGVMTYTCSECGDSYTEAIPATGEHTAGEAVRENVVEATATENGSYDSVVYCATCGTEISRESVTVPATGSEDHTHSWTSAVTTAATCTTDGVMTYTCECGASYTETIPATGHTWDEGVVTLSATRVSEGEKIYTCTVCGETKTETVAKLTGSAAEFLFSDVTNEESWYYSAVYWAYDLKITEGYSDGTFLPNKNCTRAEFATFLYALANAYGLENAGDTTSTSFTDVKSGNWYYDYVMWAAENGLVSGYSDGTFKPNNQITRAEAVTMLYGFYKTFVNGGVDPEVSQQGNTFSDLSDTAWYYNYMMWAIQNDVVSGYTDGTCRPTTSCTRSVMVVLLHATADHLL